MKYLTNFKTKEEYEAFKASGEYLTPNVSFIETAGSVINDSYQFECVCEGGDMKYYLKPEILDDTRKKFMVQASQLVKCNVGGGNIVILSPMAMFELGEEIWEAILAIAVNPSTRLCFPTISGTVEELFGSQVEGYTEITEEEFYSLERSLIEFTINDAPYQAEEGMTWAEFVESSYNDGRISISSLYVYHDGMALTNTSRGMSAPQDVIVHNYNYEYAAV